MQAPDIAKTAAYAALTLMAMAFGLTALMLGHAVAHSIGLFDVTLQTVNRPCAVKQSGSNQPCGTLADVAKTLNTIRGTSGQIELAAKHENAQLATLDRQEAQIYSDIHAELLDTQQLTFQLTETTVEAGISLRSATAALQAANQTIQTAGDTVAAAQPILRHADELVADPAIEKFLAKSADTAEQVDATATDVRQVSDKITNRFLHPPPKHWWNYAGRVWSVVWQASMLAK